MNDEEIDSYMRSLFTEAVQMQSTNLDGLRSFVPQPDTQVTTALYRDFKDKKVIMGMVNIYGCTSVLVISHLGAWRSHFWEHPSFCTPSPGETHMHNVWLYGPHPETNMEYRVISARVSWMF
ncbi:hypothetical protein PTT_08263 [Pyrenophora teres f. teres 0-1]|uniref:Uncharacterized protein n=1 Tax=Pyrenophora teres f. teres (strain 0-1) TaxID=861557 RepID=E3RJE0_PYRTT|nr:hypothetical protein PTT_08263 [Pyrenophora teres f. teres 0-1]